MARQPIQAARLAQSTKAFVKVENFELDPNNNDGSMIQWSLKWLGNSGLSGVTSVNIDNEATPSQINTAFENAVIDVIRDSEGVTLARNKIVLIDKAT